MKDTKLHIDRPEDMARIKEVLGQHNMLRWKIKMIRGDEHSYCNPAEKTIAMCTRDLDTAPGSYVEYDRVRSYLEARGFDFALAPAFPCSLLHEIVHWRVHKQESKTDAGRRRIHGPEFKRNLLAILKKHVPYAFEQAESA